MKRFFMLALAGMFAMVVPYASAQAPPSRGQAALNAAAQQKQFLFLVFHKQEDAATQAMKQVLDAALAKRPDQAGAIQVRADDPAEKALVDQWGLSRAPMPIVLAIAPNGAITGGFPLKLTEQDVAGAFVSPATAGCLKAMQGRKIVLLCILPGTETQIPVGATAFAADAAYSAHTEIVTVRAGDVAESGFLKSLKLDPAPLEPVTAMLLPPGSMVGSFAGGVTKAQLVEKLQASQSSCCPGGKCGPGGCCPGGKCTPKQ